VLRAAEQLVRLEGELRAAQAQGAAAQAQAQAQGVAARAQSARLEGELQAAQTRIDGLTGEIERLRNQIDALQTSTSWRMTAPMRRFASLMRIGAPPARRIID
jgi:predicted  nucleic acid-binding Zn-ribbon protein